MSQAEIRYILGNEELLDRIGPLWEALNEHHKKRSPNFKQEYEVLNFAQRQSMFQEKTAEGLLRVELAEDLANKMLVGYCICSVGKRGQGEIESIFVKADYRGRGIGDQLMKAALGWMDDLETTAKTVHVASGNENAFSFYARYGFFPRQTILKQRNEY